MIESSPDKSVLITGTRGRVGKAIVPGLAKLFRVTEFDKSFSETNGNQIKGDITDFDVVLGAVKAIKPDCIVHLAGNSNQNATAEDIYPPNHIGVENVYKAAVACRVPKIVLASSLHTLSGHPGYFHKSPFADGRKFSPKDEPNPGNPYGSSKVYAEKLAQQYYDSDGIKTIALRIGDLNDANKPYEGEQFRTIWLSHNDAIQVFTKSIENDAPEPVAVYFATSDNDGVYNIQPTIDELGYEPADGVAK